MKGIYDFGGEYAQTYIEDCDCGKKIEVSSQTDDSPEYYTTIYVKCSCGESVLFRIPVN